MIKTRELETIDVERIKRLSEELKTEDREDDASALVTLLALATHLDEYYTSEKVAEKFKTTHEIVLAGMRKGWFNGVIIGDIALLPKEQFAEFDRVEHLAREWDELVAQYTHDEIEEMIAEARREWQRETQNVKRENLDQTKSSPRFTHHVSRRPGQF
ncbi:MAG: hypothetical protein ACE5HA_07380 [Anaerolineae bacterium]